MHGNSSFPGFRFISKTFLTFIQCFKDWPRFSLSMEVELGDFLKIFSDFFFLFHASRAHRKQISALKNTWRIYKHSQPDLCSKAIVRCRTRIFLPDVIHSRSHKNNGKVVARIFLLQLKGPKCVTLNIKCNCCLMKVNS